MAFLYPMMTYLLIKKTINNYTNPFKSFHINTKWIIKKLIYPAKSKISWIYLAILVLTVLFSNIVYAGKYPFNPSLVYEKSLGGPLEASLDSIGMIQGVLGNPSNEDSLEDLPTTSSDENYSFIRATNSPQIKNSEAQKIVREYIVQEGDTLQSISERFGISRETIALNNNLKSLDSVEVKTKLIILPTNGLQVTINNSEELNKQAEKYAVKSEDIIAFNNINVESINNNTKIIIPEAKVPNSENPFYKAPVKVNIASKPVSPKIVSVPETDGYFGYPTTGRNYGVIHSTNGVDISNSCGTAIYASAAGVVEGSQDGWNGGYGSYIKIKHPNGVVTLYAHLSSRISQVGDSVEKGQLIGLMGTTGRSTGCHLHFEVRGARNPLAR